MGSRRKILALAACASLAASVALAKWSDDDFAKRTPAYLYRPGVFADELIGVGVPSNKAVLGSYFWYIRPGQTACAFMGMERLGAFIRSRRIPGIDFSANPLLTDSDVERLFSFRNWASVVGKAYRFEYLSLEGTLAGDEALSAISWLYDLRVLKLDSRVSDRGVRWLADLKDLRVLEAPSAGVTDASIPLIASLPNLERLILSKTAITDAGIQNLVQLPLRQIALGPAVTDACVQTISKIPSLVQVDVAESRVSERGMTALAKLPELHTLFLGRSISDADIAPLAQFKNLKRLDMSGAKVGDRGVDDAVGRLQGLEELALTRTNATNASLDALSRLPKLRYLEISDTKITAERLKTLQGFPALQVVSFSSAKRLKVDDIRTIAKLPQVHSILVNGVLIGPSLVNFLKQKSVFRGWLDGLIPPLEAADPEAEVDNALQVASAPPEEPQQGRTFHQFQGLQRIHEAESSLEDLGGVASKPETHAFEDNEKNFLGEITVGAKRAPKKTK